MGMQFASGAQWQSLAAEFESLVGSPALNTSNPLTGVADIRINPSAAAWYVAHTYLGTGVATDRYMTFDWRIDTAVGGLTAIALFRDGTSGNVVIIRQNINNTLELWDEQAGVQRGSDSPALIVGVKYQIGLRYNRAAGTCEARINGVVFASGVASATLDANVFRVGVIDATTCDIRLSNIIVNDSSSSFNNSYVPVGAQVAIDPLTGAGDNAAEVGTASSINESPPSDTTTSSANRVELQTTTSIGDYALSVPATIGIGNSDSVLAVLVLGRVREASAGTSNYTLRVKSASGGTTSASSSVDAGDTTVRTNPSSTTAFQIKLIKDTDPTTGAAWTVTGTNSLTNAQAGAATTDGNPDIWVASLTVMVVFVPRRGLPFSSRNRRNILIRR